MSFLSFISDAVSLESLPYLCKRCYIFPTRRAGYQFGQLLKKQFPSDSFIFPEIITIQDFIRRYADDAVADEFTLLTELYPLHESLTNTGQTFDKFISWGQQILKDFDEIDKYLVDAEKLFGAVSSQKQLEEDFGMGEEARHYLADFLGTIDDNKGGEYQQEFLKTWRVLGALYPLYQEALRDKRLCYEGMAYREIIDKLYTGSITLPWEQIHFCGFNAFSNSEEKLVQLLSGACQVHTWWDADEKFMDDPHHEAGNFLRRYQTIFHGDNHHWVIDTVPLDEKHITITGIASNIGQAAYAAQLSQATDSGQTCIVLCDEQLLVPLLDHLPDYDINITMGFPVKHAAAFLIVHHLLNLYRNSKISGTSQVFYYKDVMAIADDPHLSDLFTNVRELKEALALSVPYISYQTLKKYCKEPGAADIFLSDEKADVLLDKIMATIEPIALDDPYFKLPKEHILKTMNSIREQIRESGIPLSAAGLSRILPAQFASARIPFDSKRESPVQIMGFLETRLQDFDRVIILSLNDDLLPGTNRTNTFIPYNIRRGFGMPTFEQFDGINAYHFYRLLKRAKNIELIYNNALGENASEKSRFIRQIEFEWDYKQHPLTRQQLNADVRLGHQIPATIRIPKTAEMKATLQTMPYSPSSLKLYLTCPLQFYLRYIARIQEPEEMQADPDAAQFGNVLHHALELFYRPLIGETVTGELIRRALKEKAFAAYLDEGAEQAGIPKSLFHGKNKLQWRILERIGALILQSDAQGFGFELIGTETELSYENILLNNGSSCTLRGKIDRIEKLPQGVVRIIDYKTGKVELADLPKNDSEKESESFFKKIFNQTSRDHSISFQGLVYALLYKKSHPSESVIVGFYKAADLGSGIYYLNEGEPIPDNILTEFEKRLGGLLSEIIYEKDSFEMSADETAYQYSPYASLLGIH